MPSSSVRGKIITAVVCSICAIHSTAALSVESQNGLLTNLYGCAKEDTTSMIGEASILFCVHHHKAVIRKTRSKPSKHGLPKMRASF